MSVSTVKLNDGTSIPGIGFGTGTGLWGSECADLVVSALQKGYRYLDAAQMYENSASVVGRDGLSDEDIEPWKVLQEELKLMGVDYVDLYLIHSPLFAKPNLQDCWKIMEALQREGLAKSIGVSNFREEDVQEIKKVRTIKPAVNQIEYQPYVYHAPNMLRLRTILDAEDIKIETFGPLSPLFRSTDGPVDPVVRKIAERYGVTDAQVLLAWARQHGGEAVLITTSRNEVLQKEQLAALGKFNLTENEVAQIAEAGKGRFYRFMMHDVWDGAKP